MTPMSLSPPIEKSRRTPSSSPRPPIVSEVGRAAILTALWDFTNNAESKSNPTNWGTNYWKADPMMHLPRFRPRQTRIFRTCRGYSRRTLKRQLMFCFRSAARLVWRYPQLASEPHKSCTEIKGSFLGEMKGYGGLMTEICEIEPRCQGLRCEGQRAGLRDYKINAAQPRMRNIHD